MSLNDILRYECRPGGNDENGIFFDPNASGADLSQQDAAYINVSDGACTGGTSLTSATANFDSSVVGNGVFLNNGGTLYWFEIKAYVSPTEITIDDNGPNATGMTLRVGGASASPGGIARMLLSLQTRNAYSAAYYDRGVCYFKGNGDSTVASYTYNTTTVNVSGGPLVMDGSVFQGLAMHFVFYNTTRDDNTKVRISCGTQAVAEAFTVQGGSNGAQVVRNLIVDGEGVGGTTALFHGNTTYSKLFNCEAIDGAGNGIESVDSAFGCYAIDNALRGFRTIADVSKSNSYGNGTDGFSSCGCNDCIAAFNGGSGFVGSNYNFNNVTSYKNTINGLRMTNNQRGGGLYDSILYGNLAEQLDGATVNRQFNGYMSNVALGQDVVDTLIGGGLDYVGESVVLGNKILLAGNPFVDPDNADPYLRDFSLNDTVYGNACKGVGTNDEDIGARRKPGTGGGGGGSKRRRHTRFQIGV